jgi:ABC-type multidrug transport system ATPase subunit
MDAITNGLDTATTFDIINATRSLADILDQTFVISLLQPPPEVFDLFDEIILMSEGNIIYHGMYVCKYSIHIYSHL